MKKFFDRLSEKINEMNELRKKHKVEHKATETHVPSKKKHPDVQKVELTISSTTIAKVVIIVLLFFIIGQLAIQLQNILIITIVCFFLAMGLSPIVSALERRRIPRPLAILLLYLVFLGVIGILFYQVVPIMAKQLLAIAQDLRIFFAEDQTKYPWLQEIFTRFSFNPSDAEQFISDNLTNISKNLNSVAGSTFDILSGIFQGVFNFIFTLVVLFFLLMEREQIGMFFLALFPQKERIYIEEKTIRIQTKMASWFRGQMILMVSIGVSMYIGMKILEYFFGMPYAATIGLLAGVMELFPYIGLMVTYILAGLIALNISWVLFFIVIGWIALIQFLEGNLLVPLVMERVTGLPSVVVILSLAIGGTIGNAFGGVPLAIIGMIMSIPVAASIGIFVGEYAKRKH
jgi:predicted PurR-regulated permease PerM